jgi:FkbM family methyltransferase
MSAREKLQPLWKKVRGKAPFCPWTSSLALLNPRLLRVYPPEIDIKEIAKEGNFVCFRFAGKHDFWFPIETRPSAALWSEYLVVFWNHPKNFHYYLPEPAILQRDSIVFDCGACEGFFTRFALEHGVQKVYSIEPSATMIAALERTFSQEIAKGRVSLENIALSSFCGKGNFSFDSCDAFGGKLDKCGTAEVIVRTLDDLVIKTDVPSFIKMDLEGLELEAIRGACNTLKMHRPRLSITTYHNAEDYSLLSRQIKSYGYNNITANGVSLRDDGCPRPVLILAT